MKKDFLTITPDSGEGTAQVSVLLTQIQPFLLAPQL